MNWLGQHPLAGYFALAFGISWIGILIIFAARGFDLPPTLPLEAGTILRFMLLGPGVSGLIVTAIVDGRRGFHTLSVHLINWQGGARWYAVALLPFRRSCCS